MTTGDNTIQKAADTANVIAETGMAPLILDNGDEVIIYTCKAKNVGVVLTAALALMNNLGVTSLGDMPSIDFTNPSVFLKLLANSSEDILLVAAELSSVDLGYLMELELDEALKVIIQVVTVNKDFFLRKVIPMLPLDLPQNPVKKKQSSRRRK